jgi:hypothetical protein
MQCSLHRLSRPGAEALIYNAFILTSSEGFEPARWLHTIGALSYWLSFCTLFNMAAQVYEHVVETKARA